MTRATLLAWALVGCSTATSTSPEPTPSATVTAGSEDAVERSSEPRAGQMEALRAAYDAVDIDDPAWRTQVEVLAAVPLDAPDLVAIRDRCVAGYRAFGDGEDLHVAARAALVAAPDPIPAGDAQQIETMLGHSDAAIEEAQALLERCRSGLVALGLLLPPR